MAGEEEPRSGGSSAGSGGTSVGTGVASGEGELFGAYRLLDLLGRGGMGEVWRAYDTRRERTVALKRLVEGWVDRPEFQRRFLREARATAQLNSEHVVVIHDFGEIDGRLFIDMRLITGGDLAGLLRTHPRGLDTAVAVNLCTQIAVGLDDAHRVGLVHRDVKPSNVLLARDATGARAYLVDFGIVKTALDVTETGLTATGTTLGTPAYMAPELFADDGEATTASDVYALGCVFYEMLTGRRPFPGTHALSLLTQHTHQPPPTVSASNPALGPFDAVIARALAKNPGQRHPSARALAEDAARAASRMQVEHPSTPSPPTVVARNVTDEPSTVPIQRAARSRRRRRGVLAAAVALAVVLVAGATVGVVASRPTAPAPAPTAAPTAAPAPAPAPVPAPPSRPATPGAPALVAAALDGPTTVAFAAGTNRAYIANSDSGIVTVLDTTTNAPVGAVALGRPGIFGTTASPDGRRVYVSGSGSDDSPGSTVTVIDTATDTVAATVPVGLEPYGLGVSPDGRRLYVAESGTTQRPGSTVAVVDTATDAVVGRIQVGQGPDDLAVSPDGRRVYVTNHGTPDIASGTVSIIDTATSTATTVSSGDTAPNGVEVAADGRHVYVADAGFTDVHGSVNEIDTGTNTVAQLGTLALASDLGITPDGRTLVVADYGPDDKPGSTVDVYDTATRTRTGTVQLGGRPDFVAVSPGGRDAWVTSRTDGKLWRVPLT